MKEYDAENNVYRINGADKIHNYPGYPALAYSDVYIYPDFSDISSRHGDEIQTTTQIARGVLLNKPIVSAGMDTVTEDQMAIMMALQGGIGEIHRNNTPEHQAELVRRVKDRMRTIEEHPPMIGENATIADVKKLLHQRERGYVIVYPQESFSGKISGMATMKDFEAGTSDTPISQVMTPLIDLTTVPKGTTLEQAVKVMKQQRIEKVPVLDSEGNLVGVYTIKDSQYITGHPNAALDKNGRLLVGAAIGVHRIDIDRAHQVVDAGADVLFLDIAHAHHKYAREMTETLRRENIQAPVVIGNIATKKGVLFAYDLGVDGVKIGIGPGFACHTRKIAGTGVPQVTAILEAWEALGGKNDAPPIIADGGMREPGDGPKAIAAGADAFMIGTLLGGTDVSPGKTVKINGTLHKVVRGMASKGVQEDRVRMGDSTTDPDQYVPEGREIVVPYTGKAQEIVREFNGGLRSGMSYAGAHTIEEMKKHGQLIYISSHGANEHERALG